MDCGVGLFSTLSGAKTVDTCEKCPVNSATKLGSSAVLTDCQCNTGYTGTNGGFCPPYVEGKYKMTSGSEAWTSCPENTYGLVVASSTGVDCLSCPTSSESLPGSTAKTVCISSKGYMGLGGSALALTGLEWGV